MTPANRPGRAKQTVRALRRLTGISAPIGGLQWQYREPDRAVAVRVVTYLEDRRVLYAPSDVEIPQYCIDSVLDIRHFLTTELGSVEDHPNIADTLRALRAAARKFLDTVGPYAEQHRNQAIWAWQGTPDWVFNQALGELRGVYGVHLALLAERYDIRIESDLATILPTDQDDSDDWFFTRLGK